MVDQATVNDRPPLDTPGQNERKNNAEPDFDPPRKVLRSNALKRGLEFRERGVGHAGLVNGPRVNWRARRDSMRRRASQNNDLAPRTRLPHGPFGPRTKRS